MLWSCIQRSVAFSHHVMLLGADLAHGHLIFHRMELLVCSNLGLSTNSSEMNRHYSLELDYPAMPECWRLGFQPTVLLRGVETLECGPQWKDVGSLCTCSSQGHGGSSTFRSLSLLLSLHMVSTMFCLAFPTMTFCLATGPKAMALSANGVKSLKLWAEMRVFSLKVNLSRYFVPGTESWLTHQPNISLYIYLP